MYSVGRRMRSVATASSTAPTTPLGIRNRLGTDSGNPLIGWVIRFVAGSTRRAASLPEMAKIGSHKRVTTEYGVRDRQAPLSSSRWRSASQDLEPARDPVARHHFFARSTRRAKLNAGRFGRRREPA